MATKAPVPPLELTNLPAKQLKLTQRLFTQWKELHASTLHRITDVKKILRVLIEEVSQQKVTLGQMMLRVTSLEDTSNKQRLLLDHLKSLSRKTKKNNDETTRNIPIQASRKRLTPFKAVRSPIKRSHKHSEARMRHVLPKRKKLEQGSGASKRATFGKKLTKVSTSRVSRVKRRGLEPEVSVCAKSVDSSVKYPTPMHIRRQNALLSTNIDQSTLLAVDNVIYKYRRFVLSGRVVSLACKLALEAVIGRDMLKQCTPCGKSCYSALPVDSLNTIKQILCNYFLWDNPKKFEKEWIKCVKGIERLCSSLRKESRHPHTRLLQETTLSTNSYSNQESTSTADESVSTSKQGSTSSNPAEECSSTALKPGNQPHLKAGDSAKQTDVSSIPVTTPDSAKRTDVSSIPATTPHLIEHPPHLLAPCVAKGPPVKIITTVNTLPSCEIVKSKLISLDAFMKLHSAAIQEGKYTLSNLTVKLASGVIFGNEVLARCSPFGHWQGLYGLPVAEFNMLKQLVLDCHPSLWDNMNEFERQWDKVCMTQLSRKCSRLRWLKLH